MRIPRSSPLRASVLFLALAGLTQSAGQGDGAAQYVRIAAIQHDFPRRQGAAVKP